ncbi:MAG: hypothetical protein WCE62_07390 [Polyangiales bacterium]
MTWRLFLLVAWVSASACAGTQATRASESLFASSSAKGALEYAPDLYARAERAWTEAEDALQRKDGRAAEDHRTEARLWLAAAVVEADRIQLDQRRTELQSEEERWAKQLARDQGACDEVARDISRHEAATVALAEAERLAGLDDDPVVSGATLDAVLARVRFNLALAQALGAADDQRLPLLERADLMARKRSEFSGAAEALLSQSEAILGEIRGQWPEPRPGAATELVQTALTKGFEADRSAGGVVIRSDRFFTQAGQVSNSTVQRLHGLLEGFPHGPVACQVSIPELQSRDWVRRVALLVERLRRVDEGGRVSVGMLSSQSLSAGLVQCTFAAYREP